MVVSLYDVARSAKDDGSHYEEIGMAPLSLPEHDLWSGIYGSTKLGASVLHQLPPIPPYLIPFAKDAPLGKAASLLSLAILRVDPVGVDILLQYGAPAKGIPGEPYTPLEYAERLKKYLASYESRVANGAKGLVEDLLPSLDSIIASLKDKGA